MTWTSNKNCPRCTYPLVQDSNVDADHCHRCNGSLIAATSIEAHSGPWANPAIWKDKLGQRTTGEKLPCPSCRGTMDGFQIPFGGRSVVIDHCDTCGSLWLDAGEGQKLAAIVQAADGQGAIPASTRGLDWNQPPGRRYRPGLAGVSSAPPAATDNHEADVLAAQDTIEPGGAGSYVFQLLTGMPIEVYNPTRFQPFLTKSLVVGLIVIFVLQMFSMISMDVDEQIRTFKLIGLSPEHILQGERWWGLFSHMLFHGGLFHLVSNLYFLWVFGDNVEDRLGPMNYLALFIAAGFAGGVAEVIFTDNPHMPVIGASGAIAGLMGAYLALFPRVKLWIVWFFVRWRAPVFVYLGFWVFINVVGFAAGLQSVAWMAHLGGFGAGLALGALMRSTPWHSHT